MTDQFKKDVDMGLSESPKRLSSKYFYDARGDELFVQIMNLPEYYLTDAEFEIFSQKTDQLVDALDCDPDQPFELVELGAGDGTKTKELLRFLLEKGYQFEYLPIDISHHALDNLESSLKKEMPELPVTTLQGDYFEVLHALRESRKPKVVLFLGSNLGNMLDDIATQFIHALSDSLNPNDKVLMGLDLIKSPEIVMPAYNDSQGVTAAFNLNLLRRINRELGGNFDLDKFRHCVEYNEEEGIVKSFLKSLGDQEVTISKIGKTFSFQKGERVHTEISRKYNDALLDQFIADTPLQIVDRLTDSNGLFADYVLVIGQT